MAWRRPRRSWRITTPQADEDKPRLGVVIGMGKKVSEQTIGDSEALPADLFWGLVAARYSRGETLVQAVKGVGQELFWLRKSVLAGERLQTQELVVPTSSMIGGPGAAHLEISDIFSGKVIVEIVQGPPQGSRQ